MQISVPLEVPVSNKKFILNLNNYRNTHYQVLNKAKQNYSLVIKSILREVKAEKFTRVKITYTLHPKTRRLTDLDNVISIVQKFFQDALVKEGFLEDDNYKYIAENIQRIGSIDKENPRVDINIEEV